MPRPNRYMPKKGMRLRTMRGRISSLEPNITLEFEDSLVIVDRVLLDRDYEIGDDVYFDGDELSQTESLRYRGLKYEVKWRATKIKCIKPVEVATLASKSPSCDTVWKDGEILCIGEDFKMLRHDDVQILIDFTTEGCELGTNIGDKVQYDATRLPLEKINLYYDTPRQSTLIAKKVRLMPTDIRNPSFSLPKNNGCNNSLPTSSTIPAIAPSTPITAVYDDKKNVNLLNNSMQRVIQGKGTVMLVRPGVFAALRYNGCAVIVPWNLISFSCDTDDIIEFHAIPMTEPEKRPYTGIYVDAKWKATKVMFVKQADVTQGVGKIVLVDWGGEFCFLKDTIGGVSTDIFCTRINFKPEICRPNTISNYFKEGDLITYAAKEQATYGPRNVKWKAIIATSQDFALYHVKSPQGVKWCARRIKSCSETSLDSRPNSGRNSPQQDVSPSSAKPLVQEIIVDSEAVPVTAGCSSILAASEEASANLSQKNEAENSSAQVLSSSEDRDVNNNGGPPSSSECSIAEWSSLSVPLHRSTPNMSFDIVQPESMEKNGNDNRELESGNRDGEEQRKDKIYARDTDVSMENNTSTTFDTSDVDRSPRQTGISQNNELEKIRNELVVDCLAVLRRFETYPVPVAKFLTQFMYLHKTDFQARLKPLGLLRFSQFQQFLTGSTRYFVVANNGASDIFKEDSTARTFSVRLNTSDCSSDRRMNFGGNYPNQYLRQSQAHSVPLMPLMGYPHPPLYYHPAFDGNASYGGDVLRNRMQPLAIMPPPASKYLKMEELFTIIDEECENAMNGIPIEFLFEKVMDRIEPRSLQLNPIVTDDFSAVLQRAIKSHSVQVSFTDGIVSSTRNQPSVDSSENSTSTGNSATIDVGQRTAINIVPRMQDSPKESRPDEYISHSNISPFAKLANNHSSTDEWKFRPSNPVENSMPGLTFEDSPAVNNHVRGNSFMEEPVATSYVHAGSEKLNTTLGSCNVADLKNVPAVVKEYVSSTNNSINISQEQSAERVNQGCVPNTPSKQPLIKKIGGSFGFLRKNRNICAEVSRSEANANIEADGSALILSTPVDDWMEHLRLKRGGTTFIQPKNKHQCSLIREAKEACQTKWKHVGKLPDLLMLLRMIEPSRKLCDDWQAILQDFRQYNLLPREEVLIGQFGISMDELFSCGFYERSGSVEDRGYIALNNIIMPLNFIKIESDSVVDLVYQVFKSLKNGHPLSMRDVVYAVSDMISDAVHQSNSLKLLYEPYMNMSNDDRDQIIFDEVLKCPLLFWFNQKDMEVELADEVFVVGSSGRF